MWHASPTQFKHGRVWYRIDARMPKGVSYSITAQVIWC